MKYAFFVAEDFNLGVAYIISYLKQQGHEVKLFFDPRQFNRGYVRNGFLGNNIYTLTSYLVGACSRWKPDICCFSCVTATYQWALELSKKVKQRCDCKIIFGGTHPTLVPEEVKKHKWIDEVIEGCGIEHFGGKFEPDKLFPDRELFYRELPRTHREYPIFMTSFGCPFNCSYCGNQQLRAVKKHKLFRRSVEGCINELKNLKDTGAKHILFVDDIFTSDGNWLYDFFDEYNIKIGLPYTCFVHPRFINKEVAEILGNSNCQMAWMGIQSGEQQHRKSILNRPENNKEIIDACKLIKEQGIKLMVDHIFGLPGEGPMTCDISFALYREIKADIINCYELLYFPKSKIIEHALQHKYLMPEDVQKINEGKHIVYQQGNKGSKYYNEYAKSITRLPLGEILWEFLPMWLLKLIIHIKAGHGYIAKVMIENELFFTWRTILKKVGLWNILKRSTTKQ